jgi:hypothetical protein
MTLEQLAHRGRGVTVRLPAALALCLAACGGSTPGRFEPLDAGLERAGASAAEGDSALPCIPDGGRPPACPSCGTIVSNPYNACSAFVTGCVPFDNALVPSHPAL